MSVVVLLSVLSAPAWAAEPPKDVTDALKALDEQDKALTSRLEINLSKKREIESQFQVLDDRSAAYEQKINTYNSYCNGEFEEPEYTRRLNDCSAQKPGLDAERESIESDLDTLKQQDADRVADANDLYQQHQALEVQRSALMTQLRTFASSDCQNKATLEEMSCCMSQQWDGAQCDTQPVIPDP